MVVKDFEYLAKHAFRSWNGRSSGEENTLCLLAFLVLLFAVFSLQGVVGVHFYLLFYDVLVSPGQERAEMKSVATHRSMSTRLLQCLDLYAGQRLDKLPIVDELIRSFCILCFLTE